MGFFRAIKELWGIHDPKPHHVVTHYDEFQYCPACSWTPGPDITTYTLDPTFKVCHKCGTRLEKGIGRCEFEYALHPCGLGSPYYKMHSQRFIPKGREP